MITQTSLPVREPCCSDVTNASKWTAGGFLSVFPQAHPCCSKAQQSCHQTEPSGWSHGRGPLWPPPVPSSFPPSQPGAPCLQRWRSSCHRRGCTLGEYGKVWLQGCCLPLAPRTSSVCHSACEGGQQRNWGDKERGMYSINTLFTSVRTMDVHVCTLLRLRCAKSLYTTCSGKQSGYPMEFKEFYSTETHSSD